MEDEATWLRRAATWIAGLCIILVIVNAALMLRNQEAQRIVSARQAAINQSTQVSRVNQLLIETIARTAIQRKNDSLFALLERHGIRINANPQAQAPAAPQAAAPQTPAAPAPAPAGRKP